MREGLEQVAGCFLAPRPGAEAFSCPDAGDGGRSRRIAVVGGELEVPPVAAALAGELRSRAGARAAVVLKWAPGETPSRRWRVAAPVAARLAGRLSGRGLQATAHGLLVVVTLPVDPPEALVAAERATAASDFPIVVALTGARPAAFDALLCEQELVVIADSGADARLAELARDGLLGVAGRLMTVPPLAGGPSRWLAAVGLGRLPGASDALGPGATS